MDAFKVTRPDVHCPILKYWQVVKVRVTSEKVLQDSNRFGCFITDDSSIITNNESIVNYMIAANQLSQFLESGATEETKPFGQMYH